ncbi:MAG: glycosyltransferase [Candidatus Saccharibacteria bacterium]|nr:glycosyltransferase [Microbacteriaceae bacterium]
MESDGSIFKIVKSLVAQLSSNWELVVVGQGARTPVNDPRITVVESSSSDLSDLINSALPLITGEFVMIAPHDGMFPDNALRIIGSFLACEPAVDIVYTDEGIEREGRRSPSLVPKPAFSPERLRCQFYIGDAVFYRTALLESLNGIRTSLPGAELYDLALRATRSAGRVDVINEALFVRDSTAGIPGAVHEDLALRSTRSALEEHLAATGGGIVDEICESGNHRTRRLVSGEPLVSIIIPTRGGYGDVRGVNTCMIIEAVESILTRSSYRNFELVVVMDDVVDPAVVDKLGELAGEKLRLVWWTPPFNFSAKVNFGAFHSRGEFLLFLNDDTEVISTDWIEGMLSLCQLPKAGMVGAMLYFEDGTIQHAGHIYEGGDAGHIGTNLPKDADGPFGSFRVDREIVGVTAACSMVSTIVFKEAGGFSLLLPGNFNDVDLCLKIAELNYQSYWTPRAQLYHYESKTRHPRVSRYEVETAWGRWEWKLHDRAFWPYGIWADNHIG